ncbi:MULTISPECIES: PqiC family protein [unclassified Legionella]|uniref:PqiC family protein n=1 Tax=unclassified Legionella TaxID=2622702 RepID=UPI003AF86817
MFWRIRKKNSLNRRLDSFCAFIHRLFITDYRSSKPSNDNRRKIPLKSNIILLTTLILCGCGKSKESQFYILTPLPPQKNHHFYNHVQIGIDSVTIPDYIKKKQLMINQSPNHLNIEEFHQWAGSLDKNITLVLTTNLSTLIPGAIVQSAPLDTKFHPDYHLQVDISQFEIDIHGASILRAEYIIYRQEKLIHKGNAYYHIRIPVVTTEALVKSMNTNLTSLSIKIAHSFIKNNK